MLRAALSPDRPRMHLRTRPGTPVARLERLPQRRNEPGSISHQSQAADFLCDPLRPLRLALRQCLLQPQQTLKFSRPMSPGSKCLKVIAVAKYGLTISATLG